MAFFLSVKHLFLYNFDDLARENAHFFLSFSNKTEFFPLFNDNFKIKL